MTDGDFTHLNGVYKEMAELLGSTAALQIWNRYAGVIVSFPKQLYSKDYIRQFIRENTGKMKGEYRKNETLGNCESHWTDGKKSSTDHPRRKGRGSGGVGKEHTRSEAGGNNGIG